mmetsp:Transcript_32301/g.64425  ORF Transcript_32301/g.64425 Transcript_32301/m.64425 type:complete len:115 (+) Transcript_32301:107-451(+)
MCATPSPSAVLSHRHFKHSRPVACACVRRRLAARHTMLGFDTRGASFSEASGRQHVMEMGARRVVPSTEATRYSALDFVLDQAERLDFLDHVRGEGDLGIVVACRVLLAHRAAL